MKRKLKIPKGFDEQVKITGHMRFTLRNAITGKIEKVIEKNNLVATVGRAVIAQRLAGTTTYSGTINYGALGSSTTAPANSDTQLGTEVFRKLVSSQAIASNIAYLSFFYAASEANGTHKEFGTFIDGTASANTGQLFTHVAINITKTSTQTLTIDATYTIS